MVGGSRRKLRVRIPNRNLQSLLSSPARNSDETSPTVREQQPRPGPRLGHQTGEVSVVGDWWPTRHFAALPAGRAGKVGAPPRRRFRCSKPCAADQDQLLDDADRLYAHQRRPVLGLCHHITQVKD
ncbi:hypothetical protein U1Q18_004463 [Sarracenia purpurea var. burkii]